MNFWKSLIGGVGAAILVAGACTAPSHARTIWAGGSWVDLAVDRGFVSVEVKPDRGQSLRFANGGGDRWLLLGSTSDLVGKAYSITLRNRTPHRVKIVVGVDGLNIYRRTPVEGRADRDTGSILSPWGERVLTGWQLDHDTAERFVFSPPEWSEGRGRTEGQIGQVAVQVYLERVERWADEADGFVGEHKGRREQVEGNCAPRSKPGIGTTSGDTVTSRVRTVRFDARTPYPQARAVINYGRYEGSSSPPEQWFFGADLGRARDGAQVLWVEPGSRADEAGLQEGDVIVWIDTNDRPDPQLVKQVLNSKQTGDRVFVTVRRGRHEISLKIRV